MKQPHNRPVSNGRSDLALDALLHPAQAFAHPRNVLGDPDLTLSEKRAILAAWASDACAVEAAPALRRAPSGRTVSIDEILEALRDFDREAVGDASAWTRRQVRRASIDALRKALPERDESPPSGLQH